MFAGRLPLRRWIAGGAVQQGDLLAVAYGLGIFSRASQWTGDRFVILLWQSVIRLYKAKICGSETVARLHVLGNI